MKRFLMYLVLCFLTTNSLSCRKVMSFFSLEDGKEPPPPPKSGNPCLDEVPGWKWNETDCVNIEAHFVASAIGYVRTLTEVQAEMDRIGHIRDNFFEHLLEDALEHIYKVIQESGRMEFGTWFRTMSVQWSKAQYPEIEYAYRVPYKEAYQHLTMEEILGSPYLAEALGKNFFEVIQVKKTFDYPFHEVKYRKGLSDAEDRFAIAASDWNHFVNKDEAYRKEFKAKLGPLLDQIVMSRPKN